MWIRNRNHQLQTNRSNFANTSHQMNRHTACNISKIKKMVDTQYINKINRKAMPKKRISKGRIWEKLFISIVEWRNYSRLNIPIVSIFYILLRQLPSYWHLVPVRTLCTSRAFAPNIETTDMGSVPFVIWCCSLQLQNGVIWARLSIWRFIIYTSSGLQLHK